MKEQRTKNDKNISEENNYEQLIIRLQKLSNVCPGKNKLTSGREQRIQKQMHLMFKESRYMMECGMADCQGKKDFLQMNMEKLPAQFIPQLQTKINST